MAHLIPTDKDILMGRGNYAYMNKGNKYFRNVIECHQLEYAKQTKSGKTLLADVIRQRLQAEGRRFLKKEDDKGSYCPEDLVGPWMEADDAMAHDKITQALREFQKKLSKRTRNALRNTAVHSNEPPKVRVTKQSRAGRTIQTPSKYVSSIKASSSSKMKVALVPKQPHVKPKLPIKKRLVHKAGTRRPTSNQPYSVDSHQNDNKKSPSHLLYSPKRPLSSGNYLTLLADAFSGEIHSQVTPSDQEIDFPEFPFLSSPPCVSEKDLDQSSMPQVPDSQTRIPMAARPISKPTSGDRPTSFGQSDEIESLLHAMKKNLNSQE